MKLAVAWLSLAVFLGLGLSLLAGGGWWDRVEGVVLLHQLGATPAADAVDSTRIPLYGPLWYRAVGLSGNLETALRAGRILSMLSCLGLAALAIWLLRRRFGADGRSAWFGGCAWLGWMPAVQFGALDRCDAPALFVAATGWSLQLRRTPRAVALGGLVAGMSSLIRPTSGPEAIVWGCASLWACGAGPRKLALWILAGGVGGAVALGGIWALEGVRGFEHLRWAGRSALSPVQAFDLVLRIAPLSLPLLGLALLAKSPPALRAAGLAAVAVAVFSLSRTGANLNWLLGPSWFLSLALGASRAKLPSLLVGVLAAQTFLVQLPRWRELVSLRDHGARSVGLLRGIDRRVLTSEPLAVLRAGAVPAVDDPHLVEDLARAGVFPKGCLLARLQERRWAVWTDPDLESPRPRYWSLQTAVWVRDSMHACGGDARGRLMLPKEVACPSR